MQASEEAAQMQEVQQANHSGAGPANVEVAHPAEAVLMMPGGEDGAEYEGPTSDSLRLMNDGPPQPQLTIVVNSTHRPASGETDSQFHNGGVDANDADDELDGPKRNAGGGGRQAGVSGRHGGGHHHPSPPLPPQGSPSAAAVGAAAYAGPATSATGQLHGAVAAVSAAAGSVLAGGGRDDAAGLPGDDVGLAAQQGETPRPSGALVESHAQYNGSHCGQHPVTRAAAAAAAAAASTGHPVTRATAAAAASSQHRPTGGNHMSPAPRKRGEKRKRAAAAHPGLIGDGMSKVSSQSS